jgi:hypothetical protein
MLCVRVPNYSTTTRRTIYEYNCAVLSTLQCLLGYGSNSHQGVERRGNALVHGPVWLSVQVASARCVASSVVDPSSPSDRSSCHARGTCDFILNMAHYWLGTLFSYDDIGTKRVAAAVRFPRSKSIGVAVVVIISGAASCCCLDAFHVVFPLLLHYLPVVTNADHQFQSAVHLQASIEYYCSAPVTVLAFALAHFNLEMFFGVNNTTMLPATDAAGTP